MKKLIMFVLLGSLFATPVYAADKEKCSNIAKSLVIITIGLKQGISPNEFRADIKRRNDPSVEGLANKMIDLVVEANVWNDMEKSKQFITAVYNECLKWNPENF